MYEDYIAEPLPRDVREKAAGAEVEDRQEKNLEETEQLSRLQQQMFHPKRRRIRG